MKINAIVEGLEKLPQPKAETTSELIVLLAFENICSTQNLANNFEQENFLSSCKKSQKSPS